MLEIESLVEEFMRTNGGCSDNDWKLRFAARLIDQISKLTIYYLRYVLHWLSLRKRIEFRIAVLVLAMFKRNVPAYLIDLCSPLLSARSILSLCSADWGLFHVPFACTSAMQNRTSGLCGWLLGLE